MSLQITQQSFQFQIQQLKQQREMLKPDEEDYFNKYMNLGFKICDLRHKEKIQEKTFKKERMYEYIQKADIYANGDFSLFDRIQSVLNSLEFQKNQQGYLKNWENTLKKLVTDTPRTRSGFIEPCVWEIKKDTAFNFFKENFIWWS